MFIDQVNDVRCAGYFQEISLSTCNDLTLNCYTVYNIIRAKYGKQEGGHSCTLSMKLPIYGCCAFSINNTFYRSDKIGNFRI